MRITFVLAAVAAAVSLMNAAPAAAGYVDGPWCARFGDGSGEDCSQPSRAACMYTISGIGGVCAENPRFLGAYADPRPRKKVSRHSRY